jgi:REP element-mobilizing transposase RayT
MEVVMRAWLLTNTTYGSWLPGDPRGSVTSVRSVRPSDPITFTRIEHDVPGEPYEDAIPGLYASAESLLSGPKVYFDHEMANLVLAQFRETAMYRGWTLRAVAVMFNHFHIVVMVPENPDPRRILADFKAYGTRTLNRRFGRPPSRTWWTTNGSKRMLKDSAAIAAATHYVLKRQPNPLALWHADEALDIVDAGELVSDSDINEQGT